MLICYIEPHTAFEATAQVYQVISVISRNPKNTSIMTPKYMFLLIVSLGVYGNATLAFSQDSAPVNPTTTPATIVKTAAEPDPELLKRGAKVFRYCKACHTLDEGGKHKVGPNLWRVYGAKAAAREDFKYSKAMTASDIVWTHESMDAYLTKPSTFLKGGLMSFSGVKKQTDRDALQIYLKDSTGANFMTEAEPEIEDMQIENTENPASNATTTQ